MGTDLAADQPLMEAGLDSISAVELRNAVNTDFGLELPATATFDYPSVDALAGFVASRLASASGLASAGARAPQSADPAAELADFMKVRRHLAGSSRDGSCQGCDTVHSV